MNIKLLKSKMVLFGDEDFIKSMSTLLEITRQTASAKLSGKTKFTQDEIALISKHYNLDDDEIRKIFIEGDEDDDDSERDG